MHNLLERFPTAKRDGAGWAARCPAHDDRRASLSIGTGADGRTLLHCHAGCGLDAILTAANIETRDLFPEQATNKSTVTATYQYHDQGGLHVYDVVRFVPKDFRQRRADGVWSMQGVPRFLYQLPSLQGASVVYAPEGERDADRLRSIGLTATCNVSGAGKWKPEYTAQLAAAAVSNVVILPDNDEPGRAHAAQVAASCHEAGIAVKVVELPGLPPKGDVSDWLDAGHTKDELVQVVKATAVYAPLAVAQRAPDEVLTSSHLPASPVTHRTVTLTRASSIQPRPVRWAWDGRLALGTLALVGGREGIGKSVVSYTLGAMLTRGNLPGAYAGMPKDVIVAATEDAWDYTIVPRLMAAGADLDRVHRVDVMTSDGGDGTLSLPRDVEGLEQRIRDVGAAALILDPLLSRLDSELDSHKDAEVRLALEPTVKLAEKTGCVVVGLIHVNKSTSGDPLTTLMASRAFAAVARSVLYVMVDPDNEQTRLIGQVKNNLGRLDLPTLAFEIKGAKVADTAEGEVWTGKLAWMGETDRSIKDAMIATAEMAGDKAATTEAAEWLTDYLTSQNGSADSVTIKREGGRAGHSVDALKRARRKLNVLAVNQGFPRKTFWALTSQSEHPVGASSPETAPTAPTAPTVRGETSLEQLTTTTSQSEQSEQSGQPPDGCAPTDAPTGQETANEHF